MRDILFIDKEGSEIYRATKDFLDIGYRFYYCTAYDELFVDIVTMYLADKFENLTFIFIPFKLDFIDMPNMTGFQLANFLHPLFPDSKKVVMTDYNAKKLNTMAIASHDFVDRVVETPLKFRSMLEIIH